MNEAFQQSVASAVNKHVTCRNWLNGFYIVHYEQHGSDRAKYGEGLIVKLISSYPIIMQSLIAKSDEQLIREFEEMEAHQFDCCNIYNKVRVWGLFGEEDTLAHFEPLFLEHYLNAFHFPGAHTPTAEQVKTWYVPLVEKLMEE